MDTNLFIKPSLGKFSHLLFLLGVLLIYTPLASGQNITPATGGESISADNVNGSFTSLTDIIIDETSPGQISQGNLVFETPAGFEWDTNTTPSVSITGATGYQGNGTQLDIEFSEYSSSRELVFNVTKTSDQSSNKAGKATFSGLNVRPTTSSLPNQGDISATGPAVSNVDDSFGNLTMVAGSASDVYVETAADGTGNQMNTQNLTAGNSITVYAISRDQGGNFIENVSAENWELKNKSGLTSNPLAVAGDGKSATFSSTLTGSAEINATKSGLTSNPTGTISVVADEPDILEVQTQPSATNTAGVPFSKQPVIYIRDQYGNLTSSNSFTSVTAKREAGSGVLQGTTTQSATNGVVTFTDLYHTVANDISISFSATNITGATSNTITINSANADSLTFKEQPPNGVPNTALDPAPEVQLLDQYGNIVTSQNTTVTITKVSGNGNINGTSSVTTNTSGVAIFNDINFSQSDTYVIKATSSGLKDSENSSSFIIADEGSLAGFVVEQSGGGNLGTQTAGTPFNIRIKAVDGLGNTLDDQDGRDNFTGTIDLTTNSDFADGIDTTQVGPFQNGVYDPSPAYSVELLNSGNEIELTATNSNGSESGSSNEFAVNPSSAFPDSALLTVKRDSLIANGSDTTLVTVQLQDQYGNRLTTGGDNVVINNTGDGSLSPITDNSDGTYSAILTSSSNVGAANLNVEVNSTAANGVTETVNFKPGPLSTFLIEDAGGNSGIISNQTAGTPFDIKITAQDANNNTIETFDGTVTISSGATFNTGSGKTASFSNGVLTSHTVELTSAGAYKINARRSGFSETGESNQFTVSPGPANETESVIEAEHPFIENNGSATTTISVQLKDEFGNNLNSQNGNDVYISFAGSPNATLSNNNPATYDQDGIFNGTLTAGNDIETVTIIGALNSQSGPEIGRVDIVITEFNTWESQETGNRSGNREWSSNQNWSLGTPTLDQVLIVPTEAPSYPTIEQDETIDFLDIKDQATVNLEPNYNMTLNNDLSGDGTFICDRSIVNILGDLTVSTFASSTCDVTFSGSNEGEITGRTLTGNVTIDRNITVTGSLESLETLTVTSGNTLTIEDGANLNILGSLQLDGELKLNGGRLTISNDFNNSNIDISNTSVEFNGSSSQEITGLDNFSNMIINNSEGVTFNNDVVVNDTLKLTNGVLTIDSGSSLVANTKTGNLSNIRMLREVSGSPGWRMLAPPLASTYNDMLDSTVTQGYKNSGKGITDVNGDSLQPNVLFYDETQPGTDNQRWRAPDDATNSLTPGRGLFVYFFGDVSGDDRYNNTLPDTLTMKGAENDGNGTSFTFPVTYTASADKGWNLVGNPYAATIDWDDGSWTKQNIDNVVYVWDPEKGDYQEYNGIDGDPALDDGLIMPYQGFWVKANGNGTPLLKINESTKTTGGEFFSKDSKKPASIEFLLQTDSLSKRSHLTLTPDGSNAKDRRDAFRLLPFETDTYLDLYFTLDDGTQLAINNLARSFGKEISIPIHVGGFRKGTPLNGEYTLSWPEFGDVPDAWTLILKDKKTGHKVDLRKNTFYSFNLSQSKSKTPVANTVENFRLVQDPKAQAKAKSSSKNRFVLQIKPGADGSDVPDEYSLDMNYPNPFSERTTIKYNTPVEGNVQILIYDVLGRKVKTLLDERRPAAFHEIDWNPKKLASGVYICVMRAGDKQFTKKLTFIK